MRIPVLFLRIENFYNKIQRNSAYPRIYKKKKPLSNCTRMFNGLKIKKTMLLMSEKNPRKFQQVNSTASKNISYYYKITNTKQNVIIKQQINVSAREKYK